MIDLHMHSIFSDGELIPAELVRRAMNRGYRAMAITDHADHSNIDFIIPRIVKACRILSEAHNMRIIPGIELTHVPPGLIRELTEEARKLGAGIVVVHGETIAEPVLAGTNRAALESAVKANASDAEIERAAAAVSALHTQHVASMAKRFAKFYAILTPEQKEKAEELRGRMKERVQGMIGRL